MSKKLKITLLVGLGLAGFFGAALGLSVALTSGMTKTADQFFLAVKEHDLARARGFLSEEFKAGTSEQDFAAFLAKSALDRFDEASWSSRSMTNGTGTLEGSVTTDTGGTVPLSLSFVKENGEWRIYALRRSSAGLDTQSTSPGVPSRAEAVELVKAAFRLYAASVNTKDMSGFHAGVARAWQRQMTVQQMNEAFANAIATGNDYTVLDRLTPRLAREPTLGEEGALVLEGDYPGLKAPFTFKLKFVNEGLSWKLMRLGYSASKQPSTEGNTSGNKAL
jgi:hypothetical protein